MFTLAGCGGGGGTGPAGPGPSSPATPRDAQVESIIRSADTLLASSTDIHMWVAGEYLDSIYDTHSCSGSICVSRLSGQSITLQDWIENVEGLLIEDSGSGTSSGVTYGTRSGFDTVRSSGGVDLRDVLQQSGFRISAISGDSVEGFGFWGEYGLGSVSTIEATISGSIGTTRFDDLTLELSQGLVVGNATGSNPAASATWRGIAQAYDANGQTGSGTATLTASLSSRPTVDADIRIGGTQIGSSAWSSIPLSGGRFETGSGLDDRIVGHFHGPSHEEAYGTFDTLDWSGVFGAKR